jgi:hydrogenase nickel incorporation protein HypA/HybF
MHELAITQSIVDTVVEQMSAARVTGVRLEIGRLSGVVTDAVRFCFELACAGTPLDGAWLDIVEPPGRARCRDCGRALEPDGPILLCPCGSADLEVVSGLELRIVAVEVPRQETQRQAV